MERIEEVEDGSRDAFQAAPKSQSRWDSLIPPSLSSITANWYAVTSSEDSQIESSQGIELSRHCSPEQKQTSRLRLRDSKPFHGDSSHRLTSSFDCCFCFCCASFGESPSVFFLAVSRQPPLGGTLCMTFSMETGRRWSTDLAELQP